MPNTETDRATPKVTALPKQIAAFSAVALSGLALLMTGCSTGLGTAAFKDPAATAAGGLAISGAVHGGQQAVTGATIQLYAVGTSGNASPASPLLTAPVTTDANGNFSITGLYSCPANSMVYITSTQGNPGLAAGTNNSSLALMLGLGSCATLKANGASMVVSINEITTVASVFALSGFMVDYNTVGYAGSNLAGLTSAFTTQNLLANTAGYTPGVAPPAGITLPSLKLTTLANVISACVNSVGPAGSACPALFAATTPQGGTAPANTVAALASIAHNPGLNVTALFNLSPTVAPFQPSLTSAPADWTMAISYTGGGLALPSAVALDASGSAWIANEGSNAVTKIANGAFASGSTGYTSTAIAGAEGLAIDTSGNVWLANTGANNLLKITPAGTIAATLTAGLSGPLSVALDSTGDIWVTNFDGNSVAAFNPDSSVYAGSPFTNAALVAPTGIAIDSSNNVWVGNSAGNSIAMFNHSGAFTSSNTDGLLIAPGGVATDSTRGRIWAAGTGINALTALGSGGQAIATSPYASGVSQPLNVAIDSTGTVWTVNNVTGGTIAAFTATGVAKTPVAGLGSLNQPVGVALDASGNLWTTNSGDNSVTQFVGLTAPTVTPLVASGR